MRIRLIIRDNEYLDAFKKMIVSTGKDIYVETGNPGIIENIDKQTLIVTDLDVNRVDKKLIDRTIFLTMNPNDYLDFKNKIYKVFKYKGVNQILSDIEELNFLINDKSTKSLGSKAMVYAVCSDTSAQGNLLSMTLARQIAFRDSGNILILPLRYINDYKSDENGNNIAKLLYYIQTGKDFSIDTFIYQDNYGISYIRNSADLNLFARISINEICALLRTLSVKNIGTIILDISDNFNDVNTDLINMVDRILFFKSPKCNFIFENLIRDKKRKRYSEIEVGNKNKELELQIDSFVRNIYGIEDE